MQTEKLTKKLYKNVTNCIVISGKMGSRFFCRGTKVYTNLICKNLSIPIISSSKANIEKYKNKNVVIKGRIGKTYENVKDTEKFKSKLAIYLEYMECLDDV